MQKVRKVMRFLQEEFGRRLAETLGGDADYHLLTDGSGLFLESSPQQIVNLLKNSRQPMLAVCLSDTVRRVRAQILEQQTQSPAKPQPSVKTPKVKAPVVKTKKPNLAVEAEGARPVKAAKPGRQAS